MKKQKGFTLIELMVVIAVIGLLASVILVALGPSKQKARDAQKKQNLSQLQLALEMYYDKYNQYPPVNDWVIADDIETLISSIPGLDEFAGDISKDQKYANRVFRTIENTIIKTAKFLGNCAYAAMMIGDPTPHQGGPWYNGNYVYAYFADANYQNKYDLVTQLESPDDPNICAHKCWKFHTIGNDTSSWCDSGCSDPFDLTFSPNLYADH